MVTSICFYYILGADLIIIKILYLSSIYLFILFGHFLHYFLDSLILIYYFATPLFTLVFL